MRHTAFLIIIASFITVSCTERNIKIVSTTENQAWTIENDAQIDDVSNANSILIDRENKLQTLEGFGGCFNELGWDALSALSTEEQNAIMEELFAQNTGANFTICRMPLGANDFSLDWYSYNETEGDFDMNNFSIENDQHSLIPYIKAAKNYNPNLKLWASPWCPPSWMKYNKHYACALPGDHLDEKYRNGLKPEQQGTEGTNMFIQEDKYFEAYALYFSKFIDRYKDQGIDINMVMPQNEWNSCQVFPSCTWTAKGMATFIGKHLGPAMEKQGVDIMLGTMERPTVALVDTIVNDVDAKKYIKGVGFQWAGKESIPTINTKYPDLKLYQTEQECGNGKNDWDYCKYSWDLMKHYISNGANAYMYWNIALEKGGISRWGWSQNSLITVDKSTHTFKYNHEFYLLKHVSHFVKPNANLLQTEGNFNNMLAFENPDKSIIIIIQNEKKTEKQFTITLDNKKSSFNLKADSFNTICIK